MTTYTGYGSGTPSCTYASDTSAYTLGTAFKITSSGCSLTKIRLYLDSGSGTITAGDVTGSGSLYANIYAGADTSPGATAPTLITSVEMASVTVDAWNEFTLGTPYALTADEIYYAVVLFPAGRYSSLGAEFASDVTAGPITFPADGSGQGTSGAVRNGAYIAGSTMAPPTSAYNTTWYGIDIEIDDGAVSGSASFSRVRAGTVTATAASPAAATGTRTRGGTVTAARTDTASATAARARTGTVTATAASPAGVATGASWGTLTSIAAQAMRDAEDEATAPPDKCPLCGTVLLTDPAGDLRCPFDGWPRHC